MRVASPGVEAAKHPTPTRLHCPQGRMRATYRSALFREHSIATQRSIARDIVKRSDGLYTHLSSQLGTKQSAPGLDIFLRSTFWCTNLYFRLTKLCTL
jgi:hypothetical protein